MSGSLEDKFSKTTVIPKILDNYGNIEEHYRMLSLIASDIGQSYPSSFNRQNYQAIFDVVDRFG